MALMNSFNKLFHKGYFVSGNVLRVGNTAVNGVQV